MKFTEKANEHINNIEMAKANLLNENESLVTERNSLKDKIVKFKNAVLSTFNPDEKRSIVKDVREFENQIGEVCSLIDINNSMLEMDTPKMTYSLEDIEDEVSLLVKENDINKKINKVLKSKDAYIQDLNDLRNSLDIIKKERVNALITAHRVLDGFDKNEFSNSLNRPLSIIKVDELFLSDHEYKLERDRMSDAKIVDQYNFRLD